MYSLLFCFRFGAVVFDVVSYFIFEPVPYLLRVCCSVLVFEDAWYDERVFFEAVELC